ncbi:MAG: cohesin domain-containing protein [Candidatus Methanoperedens sp.]|nr:cohesin domain-containing protein [Candidatus Methanoperedens sp.]
MRNNKTVNKGDVLMGSFKLKYLIIAILLIGVILLFRALFMPGTGISTTSIPEISVNPASVVAGKGNEFNINISMNPAGNPISAVQFNLLFNSSIINIKDVTEGDFFKQGGAKTAFSSGILDKKRGALTNVWGLIITPGANATAKGTLATITIYASDAGTSQLDLTDVIISNPGNNSIQIKIINGSVGVKELHKR